MPEPPPSNRSQAVAISAGLLMPSQKPSAAVEACLRAIERVEQIVDQETAALSQHQMKALGDFNHRKSHGLLELTRAIRALGNPAAAHGLQPKLLSLQAKLKENAEALQVHLKAVQDVSALVTRAIRDAESDGTYSAAIRFSGARS
jgi:hypothetical protein